MGVIKGSSICCLVSTITVPLVLMKTGAEAVKTSNTFCSGSTPHLARETDGSIFQNCPPWTEKVAHISGGFLCARHQTKNFLHMFQCFSPEQACDDPCVHPGTLGSRARVPVVYPGKLV